MISVWECLFAIRVLGDGVWELPDGVFGLPNVVWGLPFVLRGLLFGVRECLFGARECSYEIQVSVDPVSPTSWAFKEVSNKSTVVLNNFTSGAKMWVRVRAIGADNNKGPWSDPAVKTVP